MELTTRCIGIRHTLIATVDLKFLHPFSEEFYNFLFNLAVTPKKYSVVRERGQRLDVVAMYDRSHLRIAESGWLCHLL